MKKTTKRILLATLTITTLLVLSGCVDTKHGVPTGKGVMYNVLVRPMSAFVNLFAHNMHLGYGWAIIIVTLIVRFVILPLGLSQAYRTTYNQEKMTYLAPVFAPINKRLKEAQERRDQPAMMAAQQELMKAQKDNGVSMLSLSNLGCLPALIQWPFFMALYYAARYTNGITNASFYGIDLGKPSIVLTIIAGIFYLGQAMISQIGMTEEQKKQGRMMILISPLSIVIFAFMSPAGVALYWAIGGLVIVIQQIIVSIIMKPRMKKKIDEEFRENPPKINDLPKDVTPEAAVMAAEKSLENPVSTNNRNAGKQHRN